MTSTPTAAPSARPPRTRRVSERPRTRRARWIKHCLGPFHVTGAFWTVLLMGVARLPSTLLTPIVWGSTAAFYVLLGHSRHAVRINQEVAFGRVAFWQRQRLIFRVLLNQAWFLVERLEHARRPCHVEFDSDQWPEVQSGQGWIMVSAHFGNWPVATDLPLVQGNRRMHVVREPEEHGRTQRLFERFDANHGSSRVVAHYLGDDLTLGATLLRVLRQGDIVTMAGDRARPGQATGEARLFGARAVLPLGPVALARASGTPILPVFVRRTGRRRYICSAYPPITVPSTTDRRADHTAGLTKIAAAIEDAITKEPTQWARWEPTWAEDEERYLRALGR